MRDAAASPATGASPGRRASGRTPEQLRQQLSAFQAAQARARRHASMPDERGTDGGR
jgi:hypothetical protein